MNSLLLRQIQKHLSTLNTEEQKKLESFFQSIDDAYTGFENDRRLMERSLDISSVELSQINSKLSLQDKEKGDILNLLIGSIEKLESVKGKQINKDIQADDLPHYLDTLIENSLKYQGVLESRGKYLDTIINSINEGICVIAADGKIKKINTTGISILKDKASNIEGYYFYDILPFRSISNIGYSYKKDILAAIKNGDTYRNFDDICLLLHTGESIAVSINITPFLFEDRGEKGDQEYIISFKDITKEKESDDMKSEFVAVAGHELRTPMSVIISYISLLLDNKVGSLSEGQRSILQKIGKNTKNLLNLVNDMLMLSRLEAGKIHLEITDFSLDELIQSVVSEMYVNLEGKNIDITYQVFPLMVHSDPMKIRQILTNLLGNAVKFTSYGFIGVILTVQDDTFTISIKDTGIGIKKESIEKLFSKFYQSHNHLNRKEEAGTGLGLSICKHIVDRMGGTIGVESEYGKGSTFHFSLPVHAETIDETDSSI